MEQIKIHMKKLTTFFMIFISANIMISVNAQDVNKETNVQTSIAKKIEKTRGISPYIKSPKPTNDEHLTPKPNEKDKSRGNWCKIIIDNWTGYTIDVYADDDYAGTVAAWSDFYTWAIEGKTLLYAESVGGTVYFGPVYVDCNYFTWRLGGDSNWEHEY